ncbi:MAG: magnesium transporter, partial [Gordonia sp.]|nr:magnesium transporter [Gordonia sp. (in: high G+C Gram-positive bacteria)]
MTLEPTLNVDLEDRQALSASELVPQVSAALDAGDAARARTLTADLKTPDLADVIELLSPDDRVALIQALGAAFDYEVFSELDETVR